MQKNALHTRVKEPNQKAAVLHSPFSTGAGVHLHAIYLAACSDHHYSNVSVHHLLTFCDCFLCAVTHPIS